jgi:hypothetical protein
VHGSRQLVRRYPAEALVLAAGVGFLSALAIRRLTQSRAKTPARATSWAWGAAWGG